MEEKTKQTCDDCKFCLLADEGYSNYTVEGTEFSCLKEAHPDGSFDHWYGEDKRANFADKCAEFAKGNSVIIDVEREDLVGYDDPLSSVYADDPEVKDLLDKWQGV